MNGQKAVYLRVNKQPGTNTIEVVDAVSARCPDLRNIPKGAEPRLLLRSVDLHPTVDRRARARGAAGLGARVPGDPHLPAELHLDGHHRARDPAVDPRDLHLLYFGDQTLNVFTLGGLALGVGRLVDDSIVELENIHRHLAMGKTRKQAVLDAAQEVAMPILVSTITTIVVFFPVVFLVGVAQAPVRAADADHLARAGRFFWCRAR